MSKTLALTLTLVGAALVLAGLVLGLVPVYSGNIACGSALRPDDVGELMATMRGVPLGALGCSQVRATRTTLTWVVLAPGIALLVVGLIGAVTRRRTPEPQPTT